MGTKEPKSTSLGDALFTRTQRQILGLLFGHPDRSYYAKEIVRLAEVGVGSAHRELEKLAAADLLTVRQVGNQKHYQANGKSPIFEELKGIVQKTFGLADVLRTTLAGYGNRIVLAFIYGSMAKKTDHAGSDIDLMIVSDDLSYSEVMTLLTDAETRLGRTVNPTIYGLEEFRSKTEADDGFVARVVQQSKIFLIGSEDDLTAT